MKNIVSREVRLKSRPRGFPTDSDFEIVEVTVPEIVENQLLVKNLYMSVDPYMRGRMNDIKSYVPPFQIGRPLEGGSVGEVTASNNDRFRPGDIVVGFMGLQVIHVRWTIRMRTISSPA